MYLYWGTAVMLFAAAIAENVASLPESEDSAELELQRRSTNEQETKALVQSIQRESKAPALVIKHVTDNMGQLSSGLHAYETAGAIAEKEKFTLAGKAILDNRTFRNHIVPQNWAVTVEVPPGKAPKPGDFNKPPFWISLNVPQGFHGKIKQAGRLLLNCKADCFPDFVQKAINYSILKTPSASN